MWSTYAVAAVGIAIAYRRLWVAPLRRSLAIAWGRRLTREDQVLLLLSLTLAATLPWLVAATRAERVLEVAMLGEAGSPIYVRTPGGADLLLDGGTDPRDVLVALDRLMPGPAGAVEVAVLFHDDPARLSGLMELARRGRIRRVLAPAGTAGVWRDELRMLGVETVDASPGLTLRFDDGARVAVVRGPDAWGLRLTFQHAQLDLPTAAAAVQAAGGPKHGATRLRSDGAGWWLVR